MKTFVELKDGTKVYGSLKSYFWKNGVLCLQFVSFKQAIKLKDEAQIWCRVIEKCLKEKANYMHIKETLSSTEENIIEESLWHSKV